MQVKKSTVWVIVIVAVAFVFYGIRYVKAPVDTMVAEAATKENIICGNGIFVFDEEVYTSQNRGTFFSLTAEGERVGKDRCIATTYNGEVDKEIVQSLNNINKKIEDITKSNKSKIFVSGNNDEANSNSVKNKIIDDVTDGDVAKINDYKKELLNDEESTESELKALRLERQEAEKKIAHTKNDIFSGITGVYTTNVDGLEGMIKPADLKEYNVKKFGELPEQTDYYAVDGIVEKGQPVCKVVNNHIWYIATVLPKEDAEKINVGDSVDLRIKELPGEIVKATIDSISEESKTEKNRFVSIKCDRYVEGVFNIRNCNFEIVLASYYGFEIPISAVAVKDSKKGVTIRVGKELIFKECEVVNRNDETGTVIVKPTDVKKPLKNGDKIVLGEK